MDVGIFGNTGSGKSTLFRSLSGAAQVSAQGKNAGVCAIKVPDERVDRMAEIFRPKKVTYISIAFHDIDAGETDPLSPQALTELRGVEVLALIVRAFADDYHPAPPGGLDPAAEFRELSSAIVLSDYLVAQKRIERMTKEAKRDAEWTALHKAIAAFERDIPLRTVDLSVEEERVLSGFRFVSRLPTLLILNVGVSSAAVPPSPNRMTGPNIGSTFIPTKICVVPSVCAIGWMTKPDGLVPARVCRSRLRICRIACRTDAALSTLSTTPPISDLRVKPGALILRATGYPNSSARATAALAVLATRVVGTGMS